MCSFDQLLLILAPAVQLLLSFCAPNEDVIVKPCKLKLCVQDPSNGGLGNGEDAGQYQGYPK